MSRRDTDPQAHRAYEAENAVISSLGPGARVKLRDATRLLSTVFRSKKFLARVGSASGLSIAVRDCWPARFPDEDGTFSCVRGPRYQSDGRRGFHIVLSRKGHRTPILLHELAHVLSFRARDGAHGARWAGWLLFLLDLRADRGDMYCARYADELRREFRRRGVRWRSPGWR